MNRNLCSRDKHFIQTESSAVVVFVVNPLALVSVNPVPTENGRLCVPIGNVGRFNLRLQLATNFSRGIIIPFIAITGWHYYLHYLPDFPGVNFFFRLLVSYGYIRFCDNFIFISNLILCNIVDFFFGPRHIDDD